MRFLRHISPRCRALLATLGFVVSVTTQAAGTCTDPHTHVRALGEHVVQTRRNAPVLVRVDQNDLDIRIVVDSGKQTTRFDGPGGRNEPEWIYLSSDAPIRHRLCMYSVYRQDAADAYRITEVPLAGLDSREREALRQLSEATRLWAGDTLSSRVKGIETYERVARLGIERFDASRYALLYGALAHTQRHQHEQALPALQRLGTDNEAPADIRYNAQWSTGLILTRAGDLAGGRASLETALATARSYATTSKRSVRRDLADITNLLGEVRLTSGDLDEGERLVMQSLELAQDDNYLRAWIYNNIGYVHLRRADLDSTQARSAHLAKSIEAHSKARDFAEQAGDHYQLSHIQNNLATLFERVGDLRSARRYFEFALQLIDETDDPYHLKMLYRGLGNIYLTLGDYAKSERFFEGSLAIGGAALEDHDMRLFCRLGVVKRLQNALSDAIAAHQACRQRAVSRANITLQAEALLELSLDYAAQNQPTAAWDSIAQATTLLARIDDRDVRSKVMTQHALLLHRRGDALAARKRISEAIDAATLSRYPTTKIDSLAAATSIYREQGLETESRSFALSAIDAIEAVHAHLDAERLGPAWSARTQGIYAQLASDLLAEGTEKRAREAFEIIERSRAISLRQQYSAPETRARQIAHDPTLAVLSELANKSAGAAGDPTGLPLAYYHEHDLLTLSRLANAGDLPVPAPLTIAEIQRSLSEQQLALSYFTGSESLYLFVIGRSTFELVDLGNAQSIERLAENAQRAIERRDKNATAALQKLSERLLPPARLRGNDWIVTRDGVLNSVAFSALSIDAGTDRYEPVALRHSLRMAPSLSAFFMRKRLGAQTYTADLAILADPMFRAEGTSTTGTRGEDDFDRSGWTQGLRRLPWTAQEAKRLSSLFPPARTLVYTDASATRQNLRSDPVLNARILHIASHGYFESTNPDNVGFALSPKRTATGNDSGFVTLTELFSYRFNNELVVISGCDTAMGVERGGEGPISLTRGFIAQGASHVVSTLWAISDRASADFMTLFYERLVAGEPVARAMSLAQADLRKKPAYDAPFFWAAYVLTSVAPNDRVLPIAGLTRQRNDSLSP